MRITAVIPEIALPGGVVRLQMDRLESPLSSKVTVGGVPAERVGASSQAITIRVPEGAGSGIQVSAGDQEAGADLKVGRVLANELHSVGNPVVDSNRNIYATLSGPRGEQVPFSVFVLGPEGNKKPFLAEITNPTGMAWGRDGLLYISSRHTGTTYRSTVDKQLEKFVDGLGVATGLAFDSHNNLLVGDRSGYIHKVTPEREVSVLCELEPSVSAYHLAIDDEDRLYVAGPTLSTQDCIYRVSPEGEVEVLFRGLGRPQGMAFDSQGRLQVTASFRGCKGVFTLDNGQPEWWLAGPMLVGMAFSPGDKQVYLVDRNHLFEVVL